MIAAVLALLAVSAVSADAPATDIRDCDDCPVMVVVPAGTFRMGSTPGVGANGWTPNPDELPDRRVQVASFAIGRTEVTQAEWAAVMGSVPSFNRGATLPVETVSWDDVQTFIARLNARTGRAYRLPTEAEWEYAARAGTTTAYFFGDDPAALGAYAWFSDNSGKKAHPVGEKTANPFGLYDMHGNVWEWVADCYHPSYDGAPLDAAAAPEHSGCDRVIRDGSGVDYPKSLRVAERYRNRPDYRNGNLGFRLALSLPQS